MIQRKSKIEKFSQEIFFEILVTLTEEIKKKQKKEKKE